MKTLIFLTTLLSVSAFASCPDILSGTYEVRVEKSLNSWISFPGEDRPGSLTASDGLRVKFQQNGCESLVVQVVDGFKGRIPLVPITESDDIYNTPEIVSWTRNSVTFERAAGHWPNFRKYKMKVTRLSDGTLESVDSTTGCAPLPAPVPTTWTQKVIFVPLK